MEKIMNEIRDKMVHKYMEMDRGIFEDTGWNEAAAPFYIQTPGWTLTENNCAVLHSAVRSRCFYLILIK